MHMTADVCHVMSCHVMSCHVMSYHVMSCHVMSCHVMSCPVTSHHVLSRRAVSRINFFLRRVGSSARVPSLFVSPAYYADQRQNATCSATAGPRLYVHQVLRLPRETDQGRRRPNARSLQPCLLQVLPEPLQAPLAANRCASHAKRRQSPPSQCATSATAKHRLFSRFWYVG